MINLKQPLYVNNFNQKLPAKVISSLPDSILVEVHGTTQNYVKRFNYDGSSFYGQGHLRLFNAPVVVKKYVRWFEHKGDICASVYPTRECITEQDKANVLVGKTLRIEEITASF